MTNNLPYFPHAESPSVYMLISPVNNTTVVAPISASGLAPSVSVIAQTPIQVMPTGSTFGQVSPLSTGTFSPSEITAPVMAYEEIRDRYQGYEKKYGVSSAEFYETWKAGKAPGGIDTLTWVSIWQAWLGFKGK